MKAHGQARVAPGLHRRRGAEHARAGRNHDGLPVVRIDRRRDQAGHRAGERAVQPIEQHGFDDRAFEQARGRPAGGNRPGLRRRRRRVGRVRRRGWRVSRMPAAPSARRQGRRRGGGLRPGGAAASADPASAAAEAARAPATRTARRGATASVLPAAPHRAVGRSGGG